MSHRTLKPESAADTLKTSSSAVDQFNRTDVAVPALLAKVYDIAPPSVTNPVAHPIDATTRGAFIGGGGCRRIRKTALPRRTGPNQPAQSRHATHRCR